MSGGIPAQNVELYARKGKFYLGDAPLIWVEVETGAVTLTVDGDLYLKLPPVGAFVLLGQQLEKINRVYRVGVGDHIKVVIDLPSGEDSIDIRYRK